MSLNLSKDLIQVLVEKLVPIVEMAQVRYGKFLDHTGLREPLEKLNATLPKSGAVRTALAKYIGDEPLYDFVLGQLSLDLSRESFESGGVSPLVAIPGFSSPPEVAADLVKRFSALPNRYVLSLQLPDAMKLVFTPGTSVVNVADRISLRKGEALIGLFPEPIGLTGLAALVRPVADWKAEAVYLQIEFEGFYGPYLTSESYGEAAEALFAFVGASIALGLLEVRQAYFPNAPKWSIEVHQDMNGEWRHLHTEEVDRSRAELLSNLEIDSFTKDLSETARRQWLASRLELIGLIFGAPATARSRMLLGCKWFLDSYCGTDELLKYIQATVVVETLLGDKVSSDQVGLGVLLGNRCAYLIGSTSSQRDQVLEDFRNIYDVRSRIVHRGKSRLSRKESSLFFKLHWICARIVQAEADLLQRDRLG